MAHGVDSLASVSTYGSAIDPPRCAIPASDTSMDKAILRTHAWCLGASPGYKGTRRRCTASVISLRSLSSVLRSATPGTTALAVA
jgi:hypothetical protein